VRDVGLWPDLGPPGTSAFPPLVGAKRTSIGECERSRALARHDRPGRDTALVLRVNLKFLDCELDRGVSIGRVDSREVRYPLTRTDHTA